MIEKNVIRNNINNAIEKNDIYELRSINDKLKKANNISHDEIGELFYPFEYIKNNYDRSHMTLNVTCKMALLISSHYNHKTSDEIIKLSEVGQKNVYRDYQISELIAIPFSINNTDVSSKLLTYLRENKTIDYDPKNEIETMNIGYVYLLNENYNSAKYYFDKANISIGYIEHALLIIDNNIEGNNNDIESLLLKAEIRGKWLLAKCHHYGWKFDKNIKKANEMYKDILMEKPRNVEMYLEYVEFCEIVGFSNKDINRRNFIFEKCIEYLIDAGNYGYYEVHKKMNDINKYLNNDVYNAKSREYEKLENERNKLINEMDIKK
jgi:hypothetical protein